MIDAQKPNHISLNSLIVWLREGRFVIPDFQREFEWNAHSKYWKLIKTTYNSYNP